MNPYEGSKPYAFVSCAQADAQLIMPIVQKLADMGYRLWFDHGTAQQDQRILRLSRSALVIAFASPDSGLMGNCRQDVYYAQGQNKPVLGVFPGTAIGDADRKNCSVKLLACADWIIPPKRRLWKQSAIVRSWSPAGKKDLPMAQAAGEWT